MKALVPSRDEVAKAVEAYNARYGNMDEALWCLSKSVQASLLRGESAQAMEVLVQTVRSWWGVRGVRTETPALAARALAGMKWSHVMFGGNMSAVNDPARFAVDCVSGLVGRMKELGVARAEFSLSAKVLHWIMPWRVPVYDSFVRKSLGVSGSTTPESAYRDIVAWQLNIATRLMAEGSDWLGTVDPLSPLRALDKYLWWKGGGDAGTAVLVKDPWRVCRQLGLVSR